MSGYFDFMGKVSLNSRNRQGLSRSSSCVFGREHENPFEIDLSFRPVDFTAFARNRFLSALDFDNFESEEEEEEDQESDCESQSLRPQGRNQGFKNNFSTYADWEKTYGFAISSDSSSESNSDSDGESKNDNKLQEELLRTTQLVYSYQDGKGLVPRLREPRNLYALAKELGPQQAARWPSDIQVLEDKVKHIRYIPPEPEAFYKPTGQERTPMARGEEHGGKLVFLYQPRPSFFIRSRVGGSRNGPEQCALNSQDENDTTLVFESRFESGNLARAIKVNEFEYELWLRYDLYTNKHTQWFYFKVSNTRANKQYRFTLVNFMKSDSLYNYGMRPLWYSERNAQQKKIGWVRCGADIKYYRNNLKYETAKGSERPFYSLTFTVEFEHDNDEVYFAHCFPYTYTDLQDYLLDLQNDPVKSKICKQRVLCRTLAGNLVYVLTITSPTQNPEDIKHKKAVVITSRVHPGECNASWMMKGFLDYLCGNSADAKLLRDTFIFKIVPMLNPDGVIVGNYRCSLTGRDLNRNYKTVLKDSYPSVWHTKNMIRRLLQEREIIVYCDLHGHSRKQNVFIYGCENRHSPDKRLRERIFPAMLNRNAPDKFKYDSCKFKVQKSKEGTGRIVMWNMGIMNSYTMEATFCGSTMGKKKGFHFSMDDYEAMGYHFCDTLLDYCDPDNTKCANILLELEEKLKIEIMARLTRRGINPGSAEDIDLSDDEYSSLESSDGGSDSSVSDGPPVQLQFAAARPTKKKKKLKSKKERDRVRNLKEDTKKTANDRPASDVTDKKSVNGHQAAHAKIDKPTPSQKPPQSACVQSTAAQSMKYTSSQRRPRSNEDRLNNTATNSQDKAEEKTTHRHEYLEALTNAYLRNGLIVNEAVAPHFRYSGSKGSPPFSLDGLCPHHEQTFAAQYMAQQLQNIQSSGESNLDELVRSQITHQASISPISRQPQQRHILEVSAAQQRQQDILQQGRRGDRSASRSGRLRTQVPSATFVNYEPPPPSKTPTMGELLNLRHETNDEESVSLPGDPNPSSSVDAASQSHPNEETENKKHKSKHHEKSGRKSRMGMRDSDEDKAGMIDGPDYITDPHSHKGPRVKSAKVTEDMDNTMESIKELRQSLANTVQQQNFNPQAGRYINRLMKETDHDIEELTRELKHDIEVEKHLAEERHRQEAERELHHGKNIEIPSTVERSTVPNKTPKPSNVSTNAQERVLLRDNNSLGSDLPFNTDQEAKWAQDTSTSSANKDTREKKNVAKSKTNNAVLEIKTAKPLSDRTFDKKIKDRTEESELPHNPHPAANHTHSSGSDPHNNNNNNINNNNSAPYVHTSSTNATPYHHFQSKKDGNFEMGQVHLDFNGKEYGGSGVGPHVVCSNQGSSSRKVAGEPLKMAECNNYNAQTFVKSGSKSGRSGSANSGGSREDRSRFPTTDKYFEQTNRAKSAKSSRQVIETVPTKIQLMINKHHQEEKCFGGQFLPLSRTIRAPFYRNLTGNSSKKK